MAELGASEHIVMRAFYRKRSRQNGGKKRREKKGGNPFGEVEAEWREKNGGNPFGGRKWR